MSPVWVVPARPREAEGPLVSMSAAHLPALVRIVFMMRLLATLFIYNAMSMPDSTAAQNRSNARCRGAEPPAIAARGVGTLPSYGPGG